MTTASRFAVLATDLARTDRRALSQAWYDALGFSSGLKPGLKPGSKALRPSLRAPHALRGAPRRELATTPLARHDAAALAPPPRSQMSAPMHVPDRRFVPDVVTRRVQRAVARLGSSPVQAATVELGDARVRLLVRTNGEATRIVAVCSAADRERVARALAHARFALAGAGVVVAA